MKNIIKLIRSSKILLLMFYALLTLRNIIRRNLITTNLKTGNRVENSENIIDYILLCNSFIKRSNIDFTQVNSALEIGPGDNLGLALSLILDGISQIDVYDKYQSVENIKQNNDIYEMLYKKIGKELVSLKNAKIRISRLQTYKDKDLFLPNLNGKKFDLIYSVSVLEHLWPAKEIVKELSKALNKNGMHIHVINFTDHGMFSPEHNTFFFRTIPEWIYNPIMRPVGRPNRILPSEFLDLYRELGFMVEIIPIKTHKTLLKDHDKKIENNISDIELEEIKDIHGEDIFGNKEKLIDFCTGSAILICKKL
jgi:2-polyprenyl-3-methyl-5-hydroxy-6-metoxy-1,4-benzoquinol methylase